MICCGERERTFRARSLRYKRFIDFFFFLVDGISLDLVLLMVLCCWICCWGSRPDNLSLSGYFPVICAESGGDRGRWVTRHDDLRTKKIK